MMNVWPIHISVSVVQAGAAQERFWSSDTIYVPSSYSKWRVYSEPKKTT